MGSVKVAYWGLGAMGGGMVKLAATKKGIEAVAAVGTNPAKIGKDLGEAVGLDRKLGVTVKGSLKEAVAGTRPDVLLLSTKSFVREVYPQIIEALDLGMNVVTIAEEMAYPWANAPELADKIDAHAKAKGLTVLGTGVNPGFILDTLIITLTMGCYDIKKIRAARINDLSPFGTTVMQTQGVGTTVEEFNKGIADGSIVGHIGFAESMSMIAKALGWKLDRIEQAKEPIITEVYRETPYVKVQPGMVAGCRHTAKAYMNGEVVMEFEHPQQIHPQLAGVETGDYIWIEGTPNFNVANKPECPGGIGTIATAVNVIPHVINARPGLLTMVDIPVTHALLGDVSELVCKSEKCCK
ncbi:MAG: 2,4-diaminopentanoate dehydrogenase [Chloroflexota bacterium]